MEWNSIISFVAGGLIPIVLVIISNRHQARERDKDREEQRREAKIRLSLELMRSDIKIIQDSINNYLSLIDELKIIKDKNAPTSRTDESLAYEYLKETLVNGDKLHQLYGGVTITKTIALSLGDDFFAEYKTFCDNCERFVNLAISSPVEFMNDETSILSLVQNAGKLHALLREKLTSLMV